MKVPTLVHLAAKYFFEAAHAFVIAFALAVQKGLTNLALMSRSLAKFGCTIHHRSTVYLVGVKMIPLCPAQILCTDCVGGVALMTIAFYI